MIIFSTDLKFLNILFAVGPITIVNLAFGYLILKFLKTPVDKRVSPIKFDEIIRIFTETLHFLANQYIFTKL